MVLLFRSMGQWLLKTFLMQRGNSLRNYEKLSEEKFQSQLPWIYMRCHEKMCQNANIIVSYKTYPHVDMRAAANHAGNLLEQAMSMGKSIKTIIRQPPQIEGLDGGRTDMEPMTELIPKLKAMEDENGIIAVCLNVGFSLADVTFVGPSVTVTHDVSQSKRAEEIAIELEKEI